MRRDADRASAGRFLTGSLLLALCAGCFFATHVRVQAAVKPDLTPIQSALQNHDYQGALDLLVPILGADDKNGEALYLQGEALAGLGKWADADQAFTKALDNKYREPEAYVGRANALIVLGRPAEVGPLLGKPLEKPKTPKIAAMLKNAWGRAQFALGDYSKAQELLLGARYDDEQNLRYRVDLGDAYYKGQVYPLAASEYEAVLAADSSRLDVMYKLADAYYQQRRLNEARPLLIDLLRKDSTYHEAYLRLANIYMLAAKSRPVSEATELYKAALSLYRKVRVVDPKADLILVVKNIATVYYLLNAHDSAIVELQNAIQAGATDPELLFYLGRSNMLLGQHDKAIEAFIAYRKKLDESQPPHQWVSADAELFWRTAMCMEATKDSSLLPRIAENYRRVVELDPSDERSIGGLALTYHKLGRYAEAAVEYEKLVVRYPNDSRHLFNASLPYMQLDNTEKAVEYLLRAAESDTTSGKIYQDRGYKLAAPRLVKMQHLSDAQKCYRWLMEREPDVCDHRQWFGFTLFAAKDYTGAVPVLQRAYKCFEGTREAPCKYNELRWWLAFALYESGDKDTSYKLCEKVVQCDPGHKDARDLMRLIDEQIIEKN
jgi:tetratricopeptide (TPR) repeat protein